MAGLTETDVSEIMRRELAQHREDTFSGKAPKVGLDLKTLSTIIGLVIGTVAAGGTVMGWYFQTRALAARERKVAVAEHAAILDTLQSHAGEIAHPVATERLQRLQIQYDSHAEKLERMDRNIIKIGERTVGSDAVER